MGHATNTMEGQIAAREQHARERFDFVLGNPTKWHTNKGKHYLLNFIGMREAYAEAVEKCPMAADAMAALIWDHHLQMVTLLNLERDFREKSQEA